MISRRHPHALAGAYALDALDDAERQRFERHLRRCPACDEEIRGFAATAAALAMAAAAEPPPGLRERVLAATAVTRQSPPAVAGRGRKTPRGRQAAVTRSRWLPRVALGAGAAGLAAAAALGVVSVTTQHRLDSALARTQQIASVLAAPDARLTAAPTSLGGTAIVVVSRVERQLVFISSGLPELPSSKVYELWLLGPGTARPAGLLPPPAGGRTAPVLASGVRAGDKVGVTVEPAGGSSSPTTTPIVVMVAGPLSPASGSGSPSRRR